LPITCCAWPISFLCSAESALLAASSSTSDSWESNVFIIGSILDLNTFSRSAPKPWSL